MKMKCNFNKNETRNLFKEKGLKNSAKRNLIVHFFLKSDRHYSVEELYQKVKALDPKVSLSTVYRTLKLLAKIGQAQERKFEERYIRFEPIHQEEHHDHLVCLKCGRILEFTNQRIEELQSAVAKEKNFSVVRHKLEIYGYCQRCRK